MFGICLIGLFDILFFSFSISFLLNEKDFKWGDYETTLEKIKSRYRINNIETMKTKRWRRQNYFLLMLVNWSEGVKISQVCSLFLPTICSCCLLLKPYMGAQSIHSKTNLHVQIRGKPKGPFIWAFSFLYAILRLKYWSGRSIFLQKYKN